MLHYFTELASIVSFKWLQLDPASLFGKSFHFFIEDTSKIYVLLIIMIYAVAILRASMNIERVRNYLVGKNRFLGYIIGASFGSVTPFCSCSSIPLFLGFTQARIPIGITMSFLIKSPVINEVAIVLLGSLLGIKFMILYATIGILAGIIGGIFIDFIKAEKYLTPLVETVVKANNGNDTNDATESKKLSFAERHEFAKNELLTIFKRVWKWVLIGVGLGAVLHGYVPEEYILKHLGAGKWWTVPMAVLIGIPLYSNASGIIPVAQSLIAKGLPVGTTLAFMMSTVAASFPEFMMLKQVMQTKLLLIFFTMLLVMFTTVGWIFNLISF